MLTDVPAATPDYGSESSDTVLNRHTGSPSQFTSTECDTVQRETYIPMHESQDGREAEVNDLTSDFLMAPVTTSRISSKVNGYSRKHTSVSDDGPMVRGGMITDLQPNASEGPASSAALPWQSRILAFFTMYGELSVALTPEEFALVRTRLQQEWTLDGGFLIGLSAVNATMFAITADSIFKVDSYARTAVAISSATCGLGIACDVWFLLRYSWLDLRSFIYRSRDVYGSYIFFSLSSRMPKFCTLISSFSLTSFLGLIAYDARPIGVLSIGVLVILVMILQFIVYGTHYCTTSALRIWRAGIVRDSEV